MGCISVVDPSLADWAACVKVFTDLYSLSNSVALKTYKYFFLTYHLRMLN